MGEDVQEQTAMDDTTESEAPTTPEAAPPDEGGEDEARGADDRIHGLTQELAEARRLLNQTQQQMQGVIAQQHQQRQPQGEPITGWQPEWEQNPGMVALRQTVAQRDQALQALQHTTLGLINETDRIQAERIAAKQYENGGTLWEKHEAAVEQAFNEALQSGRAASRKDLFPLIAARAGDQLVPKGSAQSAQTARARKRAAASAQVETSTPARKADTTPPRKTMKDMTPEERRAALKGYAIERQRQGAAL